MNQLGARFAWMGVWVLVACSGRVDPETPGGEGATLDMERARAASPAGGAQAGAHSSGDIASNAIDLLPADREVGAWVSVARGLITGERQLFAELDGAAAAYLAHGWKQAALARYVLQDKAIMVGVHDMGSAANAQAYHADMMPAHPEAIAGPGSIVLDIGLPDSYAAAAWVGSFYVEVRINDASNESHAAIEAFAADIVARYLREGQ